MTVATQGGAADTLYAFFSHARLARVMSVVVLTTVLLGEGIRPLIGWPGYLGVVATEVIIMALIVLARRRDRLGVMEDELRALHIPAQQPEKSELGEAPEVQDIVALLDVLVSPTHDLSLAQVLKSPLLNVADEALVQTALAARNASAEAG